MPLPLAALGGVAAGLGGLIGGIGSLFGGGGSSREDRELAERQALRNEQLQREFAQHGIRWRVEDAKAAGINPVVALGGGGASYSPSAVSVGGGNEPNFGERLGSSMEQMGQGISRAVKATSTESERQAMQMNELQLENQKLQNIALSQRITAQSQPVNPPFPEERVKIPDMTYSRTKRGGLAPVPSEGFADRAEDQHLPQLAWAIRNLLDPRLPDQSPGEGFQWVWNPMRFEFDRQPVQKSQPWDIPTMELLRRWWNNEGKYTGQFPKNPNYKGKR